MIKKATLKKMKSAGERKPAMPAPRVMQSKKGKGSYKRDKRVVW